MTRTKKPNARLYVLIARNAPFAAVFRRGPSKSVLLSKWDLRNDTIEHGQWLKGRIYERRCDLSPDGELLIYFAANYKPTLRSWTAMSRLPYLTALALWKKGDGWGGGGLFSKSGQILLNHRFDETTLADGFTLPKRFSIEPFGAWSGFGEDDPIWSARLLRDGWELTQPPHNAKPDFNAKVVWKLDPPTTWRKPHPLWPERYSLLMSILGIYQKNEDWYLVEHDLVRKDGTRISIGRSEWADWAPNGDLLFAQSGCLYRLTPNRRTFGLIESSSRVADFNDVTFESRVAPPAASAWWPRRKRQ